MACWLARLTFGGLLRGALGGGRGEKGAWGWRLADGRVEASD